MYILLKKLKKVDPFLILSFLMGLIPAIFIIHVIPVDFSSYYFQAISFLSYKSYAYQIVTNYCGNPLNSGLNARAPLIPFLMAISINFFGKNLIGIYLPFFIIRILICPLMYLVGKNYLTKHMAFLSSMLLIFIPKLQTYAFGSPEADVVIAFLYLLSIYFYIKSKYFFSRIYSVLAGISLGFGALSKSIGLAIAIGFIMAMGLKGFRSINKKTIFNNFLLFLLSFLLIIGPYLFWTMSVHKQIYLSSQNDKSIMYIPTNLPSLITTIPLYFGINFSIGLKAYMVSMIILLIIIIGLISSITKKNYEIILPTLITLILISSLSSCLIGWNIPANYEFITILGFTMIPTSILFFMGIKSLIEFIQKKLLKRKIPKLLLIALLLIVMFKFTNNYFSAKYALNFDQKEYYITLPAILKNREVVPDIQFELKNNLRIFRSPTIHKLIISKYKNLQFDPFSLFYKQLLLSITGISLLLLSISIIREK